MTWAPVAAASARLLPAADRLTVRATRGRHTMSGWVTGLPIVELATTGARSGLPRTHRVMAVPIDAGPTDGGLVVVGANFGGPTDPAWCANLRAVPQALVDGTAYVARELAGAERDDAFARALALNPGWRRFQRRAGRDLPVFELRPAAH